MPKTTKTTVIRGEDGSYHVSIPKPIGDTHRIDGKHLFWGTASLRSYEIDIHDDPPAELTTTAVQTSSSGHYRSRVPKALADGALKGEGLAGKKLEWGSAGPETMVAKVSDGR